MSLSGKIMPLWRGTSQLTRFICHGPSHELARVFVAPVGGPPAPDRARGLPYHVNVSHDRSARCLVGVGRVSGLARSRSRPFWPTQAGARAPSGYWIRRRWRLASPFPIGHPWRGSGQLGPPNREFRARLSASLDLVPACPHLPTRYWVGITWLIFSLHIVTMSPYEPLPTPTYRFICYPCDQLDFVWPISGTRRGYVIQDLQPSSRIASTALFELTCGYPSTLVLFAFTRDFVFPSKMAGRFLNLAYIIADLENSFTQFHRTPCIRPLLSGNTMRGREG